MKTVCDEPWQTAAYASDSMPLPGIPILLQDEFKLATARKLKGLFHSQIVVQDQISDVQGKRPTKPASRKSKNRSTLSIATVREIYGVARAWDLAGGIAVTSSTYSREAKRFAVMKPSEIAVASAEDALRWIRRYRRNPDE